MSENKKEKMVKPKRRRLKVGYILALVIIVIMAIVLIKLVLPGSGSKYGARLEGIEKITFKKAEKDKILNGLKGNENVTSCKIDVQGKIINIIFNVKKELSKDDARNIGNETLGLISDEVKGFYDIQYMITKKDEEGIKETVGKDDGTTEEIVKKEFPIMGYKNAKSSNIVW